MAREIGFVETFALAQDRGKTLAELIPGSEEFYYYSCLHAEQCGAPRAELERLVAAWIDRHGTTRRVREIQNRLALIHFESEGRAAAEHLRLQLGLDFDHQRETEPSEVSYPNQLDPASITRDALAPQAFAESRDDLRGFTDDALYWLASRELTPGQRRALLSRVNEPDLPNLVELVLADLDWRASSGFGSHSIHRKLTLAQLDELARRRPALLADSTFVDTRLLRLRPSPEVDIETVGPARAAYLRSLRDAVCDLSPSFNSLKAHVLYHLLLDEHRRDVHDRQLLLTYLALPRQVSYADRRYLEQRQHRDHPATLGSSFASTGLGVVGNDEPLVRELLAVFLEDAPDTRKFSPFLDERWLDRLFATTKLLAGVGDRERWYSLLDDPPFLAELKERVDLDLCATNPELLRGDAPVCIDVFVKNVAKLVIKVFELDVARYFLARGADIDTGIDLDGLVAADERTVTFDEPPLRRVLRHFEFPSLARPGVFVVELIGGGRSSRALIKKGALRFHETPCPLGHLFHVYGEDGRLLENASLSFGGRDYAADAQGRILVPFATAPARAAPPQESSPVLVAQSYLRDDERVIHDGAETIDKLAHEFLIHTTYVCRTTLTNPTSSRQKLDLLLQIPAGTLPAKDGFVTRGVHVRVEPCATESIEYAFYFPAPGTFGHFPGSRRSPTKRGDSPNLTATTLPCDGAFVSAPCSPTSTN